MASTLLGVELDKILRLENEIVRAERDKTRIENTLQNLRTSQSKLIMATFSDLEVKMRRYKREIHSLKEENKSLKNQLNSDQY